jgi:Rad3-related DNA helicase
MRYDSESNKIIISCREFVSLARRRISRVLPSDDEELSGVKLSKRKNDGRKTVSYAYTSSGICFELNIPVDRADGENLCFSTLTDGLPDRPRKETVTRLRAEAFVGAYAYAVENSLSRVKLNLAYVSSLTGERSEVSEEVGFDALERFFKKCESAVSVYAKPEIDRVTRRLSTMSALKFPYKSIRSGQDEFVRRAYRTIARGGVLCATAPTGTGKTVSALYPAVRALGDRRIDKVFYLTPKETTARAAVDCIELMRSRGADIRAVRLTAKEKLCKNRLLCRENREKCENTRFNSIADATLSLYNEGVTVVTEEKISEFAKKFKICPHELALTYSELCDVVICDFNYLFDPDVYIKRYFSEWGRYAFLVDEAHNLPDRAREMYSAELGESDFTDLISSLLLGEYSPTKKTADETLKQIKAIFTPLVSDSIYVDDEGTKKAFVHSREIPYGLYGVMDNLISTAEEEILRCYSAKDEEKEDRLRLLRDFLRKIKKFRAIMEIFGTGYEMFVFYENGSIALKLFCIDTGREISKRVELGHAAVFFSATLTPLYYYKSLLGADRSAEDMELESPFDKDQLYVAIMDKISTRYSEREDTLSAVCRVIAATVSAKRGNYIIFSPSFAYSEALSRAFSAKYPKIRTLTQKRNMSSGERESFLAEFSKQDSSYLIGFCVLGGIYAEGIDLAGDSLIGAIVVGIGMPTLSYEREAISVYYDEKYEEGRQFSYIYPGMNRVLQAAGRVIRTENDKGVIVLIDDRFDDPIYKKIIPSLWRGMRFIPDAKLLREELDNFWTER